MIGGAGGAAPPAARPLRAARRRAASDAVEGVVVGAARRARRERVHLDASMIPALPTLPRPNDRAHTDATRPGDVCTIGSL